MTLINVPIENALQEVSKYLSNDQLSLTARKRYSDIYDLLLQLRKASTYDEQEMLVRKIGDKTAIDDPADLLACFLAIVMPFEYK